MFIEEIVVVYLANISRINLNFSFPLLSLTMYRVNIYGSISAFFGQHITAIYESTEKILEIAFRWRNFTAWDNATILKNFPSYVLHFSQKRNTKLKYLCWKLLFTTSQRLWKSYLGRKTLKSEISAWSLLIRGAAEVNHSNIRCYIIFLPSYVLIWMAKPSKSLMKINFYVLFFRTWKYFVYFLGVGLWL